MCRFYSRLCIECGRLSESRIIRISLISQIPEYFGSKRSRDLGGMPHGGENLIGHGILISCS